MTEAQWYRCSECGADVGQILSLFGLTWEHVDGAEAADCADVRGDRTWFPVEQLPLIGGTA